jgi:xanthine dehydrogenase small subunit
MIRFLLDGEVIELAEFDPTGTLLDWLRYRQRRTGSKEGCAEGDCGACTVLVGELADDRIVWRAVNSCILFIPMLNCRVLMTVESLSQDGAPDALQTLMAANGSSQCGFCTPGFVMSLFGRSIGACGSDLPAEDVIAGNLCRCTGYGPILTIGQAMAPRCHADGEAIEALRAIQSAEPMGGTWQGRRWFAPSSVESLCEVLADHPEARIVAGATDVGLWVTKGLHTLETLVFLGDVRELARLAEDEAGLTIGAAVRYADAHVAMTRLAPDLGELVRRIGGLQVRNAGTVGGNIANGSPIGDGPPALIALGTRLTLRSAAGQRAMPLEDYFIAYGKQDLRPGEFVESVFVPRPGADDIVHISKLSKRFDSDISAVCGAFKLTVTDGRIVVARVAFGGMAGVPSRARACEAALSGEPFSLTTIERAMAALRDDYEPLSDVRGSSAYRLKVAANLLLRLWHRAQGQMVSVLDYDVADG